MRGAILLAAGLLGACGGDETPADGGPGDADTEVDSDTDADVDGGTDGGPDPAVCDGLPTESKEAVAAEEELLGLVHDARAAGARCGAEDMPPVAAVRMQHGIRCASRLHAQDVAAGGTCDDDGADAYEARFRGFGYFPSLWSGTITCEAPTAQDAFDAFMDLEGSCRLLLDTRYEDFGCGTSDGTWAIGFGSTR